MANARILKEWMKNDMDLEKIPEIDPSIFRRKFSTNSMSKAISWLTKHAKSKSEAEKIKKQAAISLLKENQTGLKKIRDSNQKLKLKIEEKKSKNLRLQSDCDLLEKEVFNANQAGYEELKMKTILLDAFVKKIEELVIFLEELVKALKYHHQSFYVNKHDVRSIAECCQRIQTHVSSMLKVKINSIFYKIYSLIYYLKINTVYYAFFHTQFYFVSFSDREPR